MQIIEPGETQRFFVSGHVWDLKPDEAFIGDARFELRSLGGGPAAFEVGTAVHMRGCTVRCLLASGVALLTARQATTAGRVLTHAWAIAGANGQGAVAAT